MTGQNLRFPMGSRVKLRRLAFYSGDDSWTSPRRQGSAPAPHPGVVDGRNVVDPDAWIGVGFAYRGIGRGDRNRHVLQE